MATTYGPPPYARPVLGTGAQATLQSNTGPQTAAIGVSQQQSESHTPDMPQFGATFYPGGIDDYQMPEVYAPSPQRVMPEVPQNMQQDLQRMEHEASNAGARREYTTSPPAAPQPPAHNREPSLSTVMAGQMGGYGHQYQQQKPQPPPTTDYSPASYTSSVYSPEDAAKTSPVFDRKPTKDLRELPSFSPFPKVKGEHIPPSDEEKEAVLADSRDFVLHSNDANMQICWARDVLAYVEIAAENAQREAEATKDPNDRDVQRPKTPKVEHELRVDAINIIEYLAKQDHPEALFIVSKWLEFGKFGRRQDKREAYSGYAKAAQQGWGRAEYRIGMLYENSNDVQHALDSYNRGMAMKDSAASYRLGMISLMGQHGQPRDIVRGLHLIHSAADTSDEDAPQGSFVYGMIIARDLPDVSVPDGVLSHDLAVARQYIEKAAYLGFAKGQLKMGQAYELCQLGCEFNPALSLHYYGLAAKQGQPEACLGVSRWFLFGYEKTFAKNEQLAFKYAQLAARTKLPTGEFAMGYYHEIGIHVEKDLREAKKWYELAAEHGNKDAASRLDGLSQSKTLTKQDHETTTLTRIKSQYGSQRGNRPERFKQQAAQAPLPTVTESEQSQQTPQRSPQASPGISPRPSPRIQTQDHPSSMPEPNRSSTISTPSTTRPPAFSINLPDRSKSTAPYPVDDDKPPPLNVRPKSTAPYPDDDPAPGHKPQLSPYYNPNMRPSAGVQADRPGSAFGIRAQSPVRNPAGPTLRGSQSVGQLPVPGGQDPSRARPVSAGWAPQVPSGYRQPNTGFEPRQDSLRPTSQQYERPVSSGGYDQRPGPGPAPGGNPSRLQKPNPNAGKQGPPPNQFPMGGYAGRDSAPPNPGRDYNAPGPRSSSRPDYTSGRASVAPVMSGGMGRETPQQNPNRPGGAQRMSGGGPPPGMPYKDPLINVGGGPGRASAPPQQARPPVVSPPISSPPILSPPPPIKDSAGPLPGAGHEASKPAKTGPSTFEEMGIPQGKHEADCVVM